MTVLRKLKKIPSGAIITGGGALTIGVTDSAKRMLTLPVRVGVPSGVGGLVDEILNPSFSTAIGLMLYGVSQITPVPQQSFGKKIKLPSPGIIGKVIESIRDLLPLRE